MIIYNGMCFSVDEYNYTSETALKLSAEIKCERKIVQVHIFCEILNRIETTFDCRCLFQFLLLFLLQNYATVVTKEKTFISAFLMNPQIHQKSKWKLIDKLFSFGLPFSMEKHRLHI